MLEKTVLDERLQKAWAAEGYLREDGTRDHAAPRLKLVVELAEHIVNTKQERVEKGSTRAVLVSTAFPTYPAPDSWTDTESELLEAVWKKLDGWVWQQTSPNGPLQPLVTEHMGNGFLCNRTRIGKDRLWAAYVSDDRASCNLDFVQPLLKKVDRLSSKVVTNLEMAMQVQPQNAKYYGAQWTSQFKEIGVRTDAALKRAIEAGTNPVTENDDEGDDDE